MDIFVTGVVTVVACFLIWSIWLNRKPSRSSRPIQRATSRATPDTQMSRLIAACLGDRAKAQRLVEYERKRHPNIDIAQAIQHALDRLERDRR